MGLLGEIAELGKDVIEDRDKWADRLKTVGEFIERNAKTNKLEQIANAGRKLVDFSKKTTDFFASQLGRRLVKSAKSPILNAGQHVIAGMKLTTGIGSPENGERFGQGADQLSAAGSTLSTAFPDDSWDSSGAGAYTGRNNDQLSRTQTMIGADQLVASVLSREAGQIAATRENLDSQSDWLADMSLLTMAAGMLTPVGMAAKTMAEIAMVTKAIGESSNQLMTMQQNASANAAELQGAVSQYSAVAQEARPTGADGDFATPVRPGEPQPGEQPGEQPAPPSAPGAPSVGGGGAGGPSGGGGAPAGGAAAPQTPATPSMSGTPTAAPPAAAGAGGDMAGAMAGVMGSVMGSLGGMLGGITQAVAQAAQVATQAATQAVQTAGQSSEPAGLDQDTGNADQLREMVGEDREVSEDEDLDRDHAEEDEVRAEETGTDAPAGNEDRPAAEGDATDDGAAKTLPPDLQAAAVNWGGAGRAPVDPGPDFEQAQPSAPVAAKLDRGIPGAAVVTAT